MPKLIEENGVLQKTSQINYCLKINCSSEFLAKAKLGNLLNKKLLLISTCYNVDDFSNIFMAADNVDKLVLESINAQRFEKETRALSDKILVVQGIGHHSHNDIKVNFNKDRRRQGIKIEKLDCFRNDIFNTPSA